MPLDMPIRIGQWRVESDAIICDQAGYDLTRHDLARTDIDWFAHMAAKRWCDVAAFALARQILLDLTPESVEELAV